MTEKKKSKDCPLFLHKGSNNWAKKVRGKTLYFGKDLDSALKRWADEKDYLLAGRPVPKDDPSPTLTELGNLFVDGCRRRYQQRGKPGLRSISEYVTTINRLVEIRGKDDRPQWWSPRDFADIHEKLYEPKERTVAIRGGIKGIQVDRRSPVTVSNDLRRIRAFLKWCADSELIPLPRYGREFSPISLDESRKLRVQQGRKDLSAKDLKSILENCRPGFKPIVLLAINSGIGNLDIAMMQLASFDEKQQFIDLPRNKTGAPRRFWLWPETRKAITEYLKHRPNPIGMSNSPLLFLTRAGAAWVRTVDGVRDDAITKAFVKARTEAGVSRGSFYDLRRTFQTVAAETRDLQAVRLCMGHAAQAGDMTSLYTQHVSDERVKAVCQHVRKWLFG